MSPRKNERRKMAACIEKEPTVLVFRLHSMKKRENAGQFISRAQAAAAAAAAETKLMYRPHAALTDASPNGADLDVLAAGAEVESCSETRQDNAR
jgi:hypothetical protein